MSAYAIAIIESTTMTPEIVRYLERIDATLTPYGGKRRRKKWGRSRIV